MRPDVDPSPEPARVQVLGPVAVVGPRGPARLVGARQRAVLGMLALNAGTMVPQWRLVDGLWGDDPPRTAVRSLHSHVARVRQALDACGLPDALVTREPGYLLALNPDTVDAVRFETASRHGRDALGAGAAEEAVPLLREALALWRGEALADAEPRGWVAAEVDRLADTWLAAAEDRWEAELRLGRHTVAAAELERLLVGHPLRERLVGLLMLARYRSGRHTGALEAYQRMRGQLAHELGVDPGPELARLHTQILRRDPALDPDATGPDATGPDATGPDATGPDATGPDATGAGGTAAAGPAGARPGGTAPAAPRPAQLPAPVGHFTGRTRQLGELDRLLEDQGPGTRIAVVSGLAGMGKTALAVQWGHRVAGRFPDGQLFVDLRGHEPHASREPGATLSHLLRGLGVPADRVPTEPAEQTGLYRSLLHGRRLLVVLDNAGSAEAVLPLVPAGAGNLLLVTSRHTMAALTAHHAVSSVSLDALTDADALALLGQVLGAARVDREPEPAAELARLCGRMPLALRIAAAKLVAQPGRSLRDLVTALAGEDRLDALSVEGDSRSVRAVFASAYRALSPPAARLFRLLGLHPGPTFTTSLAAALAALPLSGAGRAMAELATAHLVAGAGTDRYRFHDLIALFARQCAAVDEPLAAHAEAVGRLVDWYLATAYAANRVTDSGRDRVTPALRHPPAEPPFARDHHAALGFLDGERGNLLPVVRYAAEHGHDTAAWQLTYLLTGYYDSRGHWGERVEMCRCAVTAAQRTGAPATEGLLRSSLGIAYNAVRRFDDALVALSDALALMRAGDDRAGEGFVYNNMAAAYTGMRRFDRAIDAFERALAVHDAAGNRLGVAVARNNIGHLYAQLGRPGLAGDQLTRALASSRELGNHRIEAAVLDSLGAASLEQADHAGAVAYYRQALAVRRAIGDRRYEAETLNSIGTAHLGRGDRAAALSDLHQALVLSREIGDRHTEAVTLRNIAHVHLAVDEPAAAREQLQLALDLRAVAPDVYEEAQIHRSLGDIERRCGNPGAAEHHRERAVRLFLTANATAEAGRLAAPGSQGAASNRRGRTLSPESAPRRPGS